MQLPRQKCTKISRTKEGKESVDVFIQVTLDGYCDCNVTPCDCNETAQTINHIVETYPKKL